MTYYLETKNSIVAECFERMKWTAVGANRTWNVCWASEKKCRALLTGSGGEQGAGGYRMHADQMVNHFPNSSELCRKDLLLKNIRRYERRLKRLDGSGGKPDDDDGGRGSATDFYPTTFEMPNEYELFAQEFARSRRSSRMWIMKPVGKCRGNGIFLVDRLSRVQRWSPAYTRTVDYRLTGAPEPYVVSRYVDRPLLVHRKKFDVRLYVLVTSYRPLVAYLFDRGICRVCTVPYDRSDVENGLVHLTNAAVQKQPGKANKIGTGTLLGHLTRANGGPATERLVADVRRMIVHTLKAVQPLMFYDRHCFECYGYDVMVDEHLKPWLLEINSSPSLFATSELDRALKRHLVANVLRVVLPPGGVPDTSWDKRPSAKAAENFQLLIDEQTQPSPRPVAV